MTVTIELTSGQEALLVKAALQTGLQPEDLAMQLVTQHLPGVLDHQPAIVDGDRDQLQDVERAALAKRIRGKYACTADVPGTQELHRERQRDKAKEEVRAPGPRS